MFLGALAALAFALVLARGATYGPGLDNDPVTYIRVADNLLAGEGFTTWDSPGGFRPYVAWPPLYPVFLAAGRLLGLDLLSRVHWLNAAFFALAVLVVGGHAARCLASPFLRAWTPVAAALSLPFARWAWYGVSEAPFVLFTLLALLRLDRFLEEGKRACLVGSAAFACLAFGTRYQGVGLTAFAGLLLLRRAGFRTAATYTAISGLPTVAWLVRNHLVSGTLTGVSSAPDYDAAESWSDIGNTVLAWARFDAGSVPLLALGALIPLAALLLSRGGSPAAAAFRRPAARRRRVLLFGGFSLSFIGLYFLALMLGEAESGVESRHLFPARLPLVLAFAAALDPLLEPGRGRRLLERVGGVAAAAVLSVWAAGQIGLQRRAIGQANSPEVLFDNGYLGEPWASSEVMRFLRADASGGSRRIYTNLRSPVFAWVGGRPDLRPVTGWSRDREAPGGAFLLTPREVFSIFMDRAPDGARVAWISDFRRPYHRSAPPAALFATPILRPLAEFDDGAVFVVDRRRAPPSDRFREAYEFWGTEEPDAEADFQVYFDRGSVFAAGRPTLFYRRASCRRELLRDRFFLHVFPRAPESLPAEAAPHGFENLDFAFFSSGVLLQLADGTWACLATVRLPAYGIARLSTGQHRSGAPIWNAEIRFR